MSNKAEFDNYTSASPLNIGPINFGLDDPKINRTVMNELRLLPARKIASAKVNRKFYPIYRTGTRSGAIYLIADDQLVYYVKYGARKLKYLPETITQFVLWRKLNITISPAFTENLFFKVILPITGSVMSDREQTVYGQNFWRRRLDQAYNRGYQVYLVDLSGQRIHTVESTRDLDRLLDKAWGSTILDTPDHKDQKWLNLRWVISKKALHA